MRDFKLILKYLSKFGYPNPNIHNLFDSLNYDTDYFLRDLKKEVGEVKLIDFCDKAIEKLSGEKGIRVNLDGPNGDEYCYVHIYPIYYSEDESENDVISNYSFGDSKILHKDENGEPKYFTMKEIIDMTDMSEWGEVDDLIDYIKSKAYNIVFQNCGFGIWWE